RQRAHRDRLGLLLQRPARTRRAHRVGRLPAAPQSQMRTVAIRVAAVALVTAASATTVRPEASDLDSRVVKLVQSVSEDHLVATLKKLESFGTRSTLSSTDQPDRGIGAAREWILKEMTSYSPRLKVSFDTYQVAKQGRITRD